MSLESEPQIQPETPKRNKKERFSLQKTGRNGVFLRTEPDTEVKIPPRMVGVFLQKAKRYARLKKRIGVLDEVRSYEDKGIKSMIKAYKGLRGIKSVRDNLVLTVIPRKKVTYNQGLLKASLGDAYSTVVHEDDVITVSPPVPYILPELLSAIDNQLIASGVKTEDIEKIVKTETVQRIDEKRLQELVDSGRVTLLEGTRTEEIDYSITVDTIV
jgi:hypothetical protein